MPTIRPKLGSLLRWLPAAAAGTVTAYAALAKPAERRLSDLGVYLGAVNGLRHGASLYDFANAKHAPFTYPPFAGILFLPLTWFPTLIVQIVWTLATLVVVTGLTLLLARAARPRVPQKWQPWLAPALGFVLAVSAPVASNVRFGQVSVLLAAIIAVDVLALRHSRYQGALIGLAAAIKLTPLIFVPLLWFTGRRRAAMVAAATFGLCGALAALILPHDSLRFWTIEVRDVSRIGDLASTANQSFNGFLVREEIGTPLRSYLMLAVGGAVAVLALWRAARAARHEDQLTALILVGTASVVVSPVSWTHHQVWLVLCVLLPVAMPRWGRIIWVAVVLAVTIVPVVSSWPLPLAYARLLLAITAAALIPLSPPPRNPAGEATEPARDLRLPRVSIPGHPVL